MTNIKNPRFPHSCRIIRYAATEPMEDQDNISEYGPMMDDLLASDLLACARIVYEGECRSDNRDTISDNGEVIASYRTLALPLKQDEWTEETIPLEGDKIELQRFGYKEYGLVIDKRPSNLGTHILWKYVRN